MTFYTTIKNIASSEIIELTLFSDPRYKASSQWRNAMRYGYHKPAKQVWAVGQIVNVGFLKNLTVMERIPTPGDYRPDVWRLIGANGAEYEFTPHCGIARVN